MTKESAAEFTDATPSRTGPAGARSVIQSDLERVETQLRAVRRRRAALQDVEDPRQRRAAEVELDQEEDRLKDQLENLRQTRAQFV